MSRTGTRSRRTISLAVAALATLAITTSSAAAPEHGTDRTHVPPESTTPETARVTGSAQVHYAYSPDDDIRFSFDARATPFTGPGQLPTDATGRIRFSHRVAATGERQWAVGKVECLLTAGPVATLSAVVTHASPGAQDWIGDRLGFSVYDDGHHAPHSRDRVGFSWGMVAAPNPAGCMAPAPFTTVTRGGFTVDHAEPPPLPTSATGGSARPM